MASSSEQELIRLARTRGRAYLRLPNVTSVGVGRERVNGQPTDRLSIQFTVAKKLPPELLAAQGLELLPETLTTADGTVVPVDVVERSYAPSYRIVEPEAFSLVAPQNLTTAQVRRRRMDPVQPGISVGHPTVQAGTVGGIVFDMVNGTPYILSNWHVLHGPAGKVGDVVVQPGPEDDANISANGVGRLVRSHLGLSGDCAVASIEGRGIDLRLLEMGVVPRRIAEPSEGDRVVKSGRTTGVTFGKVDRVGVIVPMNYGGGVVQQVGGFEIIPNPDKPPTGGEISDFGDSGALWMIDTDGPDRDVVVGLQFAGEINPQPLAELAVACSIRTVCEKLQVTFTPPSVPQGVPAARRQPSRRKKNAAR
jgi:endonuclease G, mitochondrial